MTSLELEDKDINIPKPLVVGDAVPLRATSIRNKSSVGLAGRALVLSRANGARRTPSITGYAVIRRSVESSKALT
jgi:hypothetical protein